MSKQITKILVVEDNPQHLKEAMELLTAKGFDVATAVNADDGLQRMYQGDYKKDGARMGPVHQRYVDAVITDVYLPLSSHPSQSSPENPCGLLVASGAQAAGLPVVLCTAGSHHGRKYEWVYQLCLRQGWNLVDQHNSRNQEAEAPSKDWERALTVLMNLPPQD